MLKFLLLFLLPYTIYASSLHDAIIHMDEKALVKAIKSTSNINKLYKGETALMLAIKSGHIGMAKLLLNNSADANLGEPIKIALLKDNSEMIGLLLKNHAHLPRTLGFSKKTLIYDLLLKRLYNSVATLLDHGVKFRKKGKLNAFSLALSFAPLSLVETFIKNGADLNYKDPYLDKPLDIALRLKRHDLVKLLIDYDVKVEDSHALEIAVAHNDLVSLKLLLKAGSFIDDKRENLLFLAVKLGNLSLLKELFKAGLSLNYTSENQETALTQAIKYKNKEIINWLLQSELDSGIHKKAIFYAISHGDLDILKAVAEKEIGLGSKNESGLSPLLYANTMKKFDMVDFLLTLDVDIEAKDKAGENALFKSIRFFQDTTLETLLVRVNDIDMKSSSGLSALGLTLLTSNFEAFKTLLKAGATVDEEIVILSVKKGLERFFLRIKDRLFLPSIKDDKSNTLLHIAAENNRIGILKRLILDGFDTEVMNERGETALHLAAKEGYKSSLALLLSFDANVSALDERGYNAMNLALKNNHAKLSKWLENYQVKQEERLRIKEELIHNKDNNESNVSAF